MTSTQPFRATFHSEVSLRQIQRRGAGMYAQRSVRGAGPKVRRSYRHTARLVPLRFALWCATIRLTVVPIQHHTPKRPGALRWAFAFLKRICRSWHALLNSLSSANPRWRIFVNGETRKCAVLIAAAIFAARAPPKAALYVFGQPRTHVRSLNRPLGRPFRPARL